jgi:cyclic pyranopterin monophosphate synthase
MARMVDVTGKPPTTRTAVATGRVRLRTETVAALRAGPLPKGDVLTIAAVAAVMGAKRVPDLIPLCHPIALHAVSPELTVADDGVEIRVTCRTADRTGVEMEALTAVAVAALTVVDLVKGMDPGAVVEGLQVVEKTGGATGDWRAG